MAHADWCSRAVASSETGKTRLHPARLSPPSGKSATQGDNNKVDHRHTGGSHVLKVPKLGRHCHKLGHGAVPQHSTH